MTGISHSVNSDIIQQYQSRAGQDVFQAIEKASHKTGVDFAYLLDQASAESNFNPSVKAKTSSATGLYQFLDQTWLQTVAKHGYKHGLGEVAGKIDISSKGYANVSDPSVKREILNLRKNPEIAANMAAEFAKDNQSYLESNTKSDIGSTEMYLAHFLGAGGATKFINSMDQNANKPAHSVFPAAAKANKNVFYNQNGSAKSLDQVYAFFDKKFSDEKIQPNSIPDTMTAAVELKTEVDTVTAAADPKMKVDTNAKAKAIYSSYATTTFSNADDLFRVNNEMDVMLLSNMISRWTHQDASKAYQEAYGRIG